MRRACRRGREEGSIAPAVPVVALVVLLLAGLVVDGSRQLNERARAVAYAEEAARAGAAAIRLDSAELELLPRQEVAARVNGYCRDAAAAGAPIENPDDCFAGIEDTDPALGTPQPLVVVARVRTSIPAGLLGMVGVRRLDAAGTARARPWEGLDEEDLR
ncbi:pilus assembly protein TadG-related protein [Kineococcus glutinatus]|uniref:Putative Flp pilus-assembly TadG-like N-terminal domain-containing protein n=1 Tax=Kineococcus glutinatus TaxID=1070872 RepID=A0ABP8VFQ2_9ACTN